MSAGRSYAAFRRYVARRCLPLASLYRHKASAQQQGSSEELCQNLMLCPFSAPTGSGKSLPESTKLTTMPSSPKRILGIFPNYRAVSTTTQVHPLSLRQRFWLATQDSFDYSSFIIRGVFAESDWDDGFGHVFATPCQLRMPVMRPCAPRARTPDKSCALADAGDNPRGYEDE